MYAKLHDTVVLKIIRIGLDIFCGLSILAILATVPPGKAVIPRPPDFITPFFQLVLLFIVLRLVLWPFPNRKSFQDRHSLMILGILFGPLTSYAIAPHFIQSKFHAPRFATIFDQLRSELTNYGLIYGISLGAAFWLVDITGKLLRYLNEPETVEKHESGRNEQ